MAAAALQFKAFLALLAIRGYSLSGGRLCRRSLLLRGGIFCGCAESGHQENNKGYTKYE
jgi:hypothetical protein